MSEPWWVIYYDDGSRFSSECGAPEDAPRLGVQVIVQHDPQEREPYMVIHAGNYYVWRGTRWHAADQFGFHDYYFFQNGLVALAGRTMGDAEFRKILEHARAIHGKRGATLPEEVRLHNNPLLAQ